MFPEPLLPPGQSFRGLKEALPYATCAIHGSQTALMHRLEGLWTPSGYVQAIDHYGVAMQSALYSSSLGSPGNDTLSLPCPARWHRVSIKPIVQSRRADSNRLPLLQLRVIIHALQGCARGCKCRISRRFSFLQFAECCAVLRSRWCQSGVKREQAVKERRHLPRRRQRPLRAGSSP
jgi:hypothetical protein